MEKKRPQLDVEPRERILKAAYRVFLAKGRQGARTREIAREARVNLAMVHYYFHSKDELYQQVVSPLLIHFFYRLKKASESDPDPKKRLEAVIHTYFDFLSGEPDFPRFMIWELTGGAVILKKIFAGPLDDKRKDLVSNLRDIFRNGQEKGLFKSHNVDQAVLSMVALCIFPFVARDVIQVMNPDWTQQPDFLEERRRHILNLLLNGLSAEERGGYDAS
jgi:AcrR family transcriptional regulator